MLKIFTLVLSVLFITNVNAKELNIITSFSILEDITTNITKDKAKVISIVPWNSEPHGYNLTPQNLKDIEKSDLIILNGLGFEGYLNRLVNKKNSNKIVIASDNISTLEMEHSYHNDHKHHHGHTDPHAWQNPLNIVIYVQNITNKLCEIDSENCNFYKDNSSIYIEKLKEIDKKYINLFSNLKSKDKIIITTHKALDYLSHRYDVMILSPYDLNNKNISAKHMASLSRIIKEKKITSIFAEYNANNQILNEFTNKNNLQIEETLFTDNLSKETKNCSTYLDFITHNLEVIYKSLTK
jgi:zinc/manganese transport system substrate-binding protein